MSPGPRRGSHAAVAGRKGPTAPPPVEPDPEAEAPFRIELVIASSVPSSVEGALAQAGPCIVRDGGAPLVGVMFFDVADLEALESRGQLQAVLLHEVGHVLGIGTLWAAGALLESPSLPDDPARIRGSSVPKPRGSRTPWSAPARPSPSKTAPCPAHPTATALAARAKAEPGSWCR